MIKLKRLSGDEFVLNAEYIKFIEETPDTIITLRDGEKLIVSEKIDDVIKRVVEYKRSVSIFDAI
jgi:flagellar protein FlbD